MESHATGREAGTLSRARSLAEAGIFVRHETPGRHRTACPECARGKRRQRDDALAVTVEPDGGAVWLCHRCGWTGGLRPPGAPPIARSPRRPDAPRKPFPAVPNRSHGDPGTIKGPSFEGEPARLWQRCAPIIPGTVAAVYLERRGCALPHPDGDLRWLPALRHPSGAVLPALVALVTDAVTAEPMTLHRTWLRQDGAGKAELDRVRLLWPGLPKGGGVVRLWPDEEVTMGLGVAEGIETALTMALGLAPVWAAIDAGNLAKLPVLPGIESITIAADHDPPNPRTGRSTGIEAAEACAQRWADAGREARLWLAPEQGKDLNDWCREIAA